MECMEDEDYAFVPHFEYSVVNFENTYLGETIN